MSAFPVPTSNKDGVPWVKIEHVLQNFFVFRCELCEKAFKSSNTLLTHKRDTHKIVGPKAKREEGTGRVESWRVWKKDPANRKKYVKKKKTA